MRSIFRVLFGASVVLSILTSNAFAQDSTSSASVARSRALANSANPNSYRSSQTFVVPDEVLVEEFVNYHRHQLPLPKIGQSVAVDARWGNDEVSVSRREAVLQIGFATAFANERTDLRPLNLSLVIDKSGSMAAEDKMSRVKESLRKMVAQLRPDDIVSIVVFDSEAKVLCPSVRVGNGYRLKRAIDSITADGSTNLHGGLMLGYKEAQKNFEKDSTNRVILLTDGIANVGTTDPKTIAVESSEYNGQGIDLSTIGVGIDLDRELLRTLSKQGHGLFHFVADAHDIKKVFVKEVQSLISPVARRVNLEVEFDSNLEVAKVFGYEPKFNGNRVSIPIDDMNNGLTQIVLMKFRLENKKAYERDFPVKIRLSYFDIKTRKQIVETQTANLRFIQNNSGDLLADSLVRKNYTIAELAQSLYEMSEVAKERDYRTAENLLNTSVSNAYRRYPNMEDQDIKFILNIVEDYQRNLRNLNGSNRGDGCGKCE
jgi:Mg-chelatase subunit ChlD